MFFNSIQVFSMMEKNYSQNMDTSSKHLLDQLITARKEINNLRQQIKSLRYVHERDVNSIKRLLGLCTSGLASFPNESLANDLSDLSRVSEPSTSNSQDGSALNFCPIGVISTWFPSKRGTPRQPVVCDRAPGKITLFKSVFTNPEHALQGLEEFSHMWVLFHFHKNEVGHVRAKVAPPRLNGMRTGVFSTRSPHRPCPIGLSLVKINKIEDCTIYFEGVDMVDQTPVLDIKPYIPNYDNPLHIEKMLYCIGSKEPLADVNSAASVSSIDNVDSWSVNDINEDVSIKQTTASSLIDVSRDEELALRLQAEEFQENLNFDNENISTYDDSELAAIIANRSNQNPISYDVSDPQISANDDPNLVNSRLLEGADGPNAVCGTDLDLMSRRALNLRLDDSSSSSSPIRMGVREAPDGEEGFDISQTNSSNSIPSSLLVDRQNSQSIREESVRVPDWITRPETSTLSVVFNERSILQLHEILQDKADEKKQAVENVLKEDPRSVYLRRRYGNQFYTFLIHNLHITCKFDDERKIVTVFQIRHAGRTCECGQPEWQCTGHSPSPVFSHDQ